MNIHLEHHEISQAILDYIEGQGIDLAKYQDIEVKLSAGRSNQGHYANVSISNPTTEVAEQTTVAEPAEAGEQKTDEEHPFGFLLPED